MERAPLLSGSIVGGILLCLVAVAPASSAYYHDLQKNRQPCGDCHTLHYSEGGGQPAKVEPGGPFAQLLVRATTNKLCLFCHDGSDPKAPDVIEPVAMYAGSGDEHSGAGSFANSGGVANPNGHDLGVNATEIPFSSLVNISLTCASCHDPHGTPNYRNVLTAPAGGSGIGVVMGTDLFHEVPPGDPPSTTASVAAYKESNLGYKGKTSAWCTECHDRLKSAVNVPGNRAHHFTDVPLDGAGYPTDPAHWVAGTGAGFGTVTGDIVEGVPRLRFQVPGALDFPASKAVAGNNQVMCGTCHLAHGGKYREGLAWPYGESGSPADANSGCQQCHNQ